MLNFRLIFLLFLVFISNSIFSQTENPVLYGGGHISFIPDARANALGGSGIATSPDLYSIFWNPSKYVFMDKDLGLGVSYESKFSHINVEGAYYSNVVAFYRLKALGIDDVVAINFSYFKNGEAKKMGIVNKYYVELGGVIAPYEFSTDVAYSTLVLDNFSVGGDLKFIYSNLSTNNISNIALAGGLSCFYITEFTNNKINYLMNFGANISNIGSKLGDEFLPANLGIGTSMAIEIDEFHSITASFDLNKLMVPTPPSKFVKRDSVTNKIINIEINGETDDVSSFGGIIQSFNDAPNGVTEEIQEISFSFGLEYSYLDKYFVRAGYLSENEDKGSRSHLSFGLGANIAFTNFDISYIYATTDYASLSNQIMFTIRFEVDSENLKRLISGDFDFSDQTKKKRRRKRRNRK